VPKYHKRTRRLVLVLVCFLVSARASHQYLEWSAVSFQARVTRLGAVARWLDTVELQRELPFQDIPLMIEFLQTLQGLWTETQTQEHQVFLTTVRDTWRHLTKLLVHDCFLRANEHRVLHSSHDPTTLDV
jgi:hypothetical protein